MLLLLEGDLGDCGIAVLVHFLCGISVISIYKYGIAEILELAVRGLLPFYEAIIGKNRVFKRYGGIYYHPRCMRNACSIYLAL